MSNKTRWLPWCTAVVSMIACMASAEVPALTPEFLATLSFEQHPGTQLPLQADLRNEAGRHVQFGSLLQSNKPAILVFADYECVHLCSVVLNATLESAKALRLTAGVDYQIIVVSIRPEESPATANARQHTYSTRYGRGEKGWHFLVQGSGTVRALADAAGFPYAFDPVTKQFAHPSGIVVLTPDGKVSRYLQGLEYRPDELQTALVAASAHRIGPLAERLLLLCFHYDPATGRYGLVIMRAVQIAGLGTVLLLGSLIVVLRMREKRHEGGLVS